MNEIDAGQESRPEDKVSAVRPDETSSFTLDDTTQFTLPSDSRADAADDGTGSQLADCAEIGVIDGLALAVENLCGEQREFSAGFQRFFNQWESGNPNDAVLRVERAVAEILAALAERPERPVRTAENEADAAFDEAVEHDGADTDDDNPLSAWEAIKQQYVESDTDEMDAASDENFDYIDDSPEWIDPPELIDVDAAGPDELRDAAIERDEYISFLIRRLRAEERRSSIAPHQIAQLEGDTDELACVVAAAEQRLDEMLRLTEIELSMERARLSRLSAELQERESSMARDLRRLKQTSDAAVLCSNQEAIAEPKPRRWMKMLGIGSSDGE